MIREGIRFGSRQFLVRCCVTLAASIGLAILVVLVLPTAADGAPRTFTLSQIEAIAEKERTIQRPAPSDLAMSPAYGSGVGVEAAFIPLADPSDPTDVPSVGTGSGNLFSAYTYKGENVAGVVNLDNQSDAVNLFFGGYASIEDLRWDIGNQTYTRSYDPSYWDDDTEGRFYVETRTKDGNVCNPRDVYLRGDPTGNEIEIVSRNAYGAIEGLEDPCNLRRRFTSFPPSTDYDANRMHIRVWSGGYDVVHGYWAVGAAHYDPDDHGDGSRHVEDTERLLTSVFSEGGENSTPLWFVADIWEFDVPDPDGGLNNVDPAGCGLPKPENLTPCDGEAHYVQLIA